MWYVVVGVVCFIIGAAAMWYYNKRQVGETPAPVPEDPAVLDAVKKLHSALFAGFGMKISPVFNNLWKAAGLPQKGVPNITNGST